MRVRRLIATSHTGTSFAGEVLPTAFDTRALQMIKATVRTRNPWFRFLSTNNALPIQARYLLVAAVAAHAIRVILAPGGRLLLDLFDEPLVLSCARLTFSDVRVVPVAAKAFFAIGVVLAVFIHLRLFGLLLVLLAANDTLPIQAGDILVAAVTSRAVRVILALG